MQFSVRHLLFLMALVAIFATALSFPNRVWAATIKVVVWIVFGQLIWNAAIRSGRVRISCLLALASGVSYLLFCSFWYGNIQPVVAPSFLRTAYQWLHAGGSGAFYRFVAFVLIAEYGIAMIVALAGGLVGALVARK